ncbi:MAG: DNA repair exonuclease [Acidimicrobiaceae bacterium]|nr:DNA repair exonuclease [Acidimicrobiaceae bacterium]MCY4175242.1 DNA repair exonuclease [Acidimicrobiaceae bacterium]MCY4280008.1 DNA repair exonuclease [Acidimicrobiaceae bacterium]MCY4294930.1 DNA repair exonuclease [Acidimicrobiaceae bacterium]
MVKFLHTADWQLGMTRHFLDGDAQARFSAARLDCITVIGRLAEAEDCDFVVVCGDVFESNHIERQVLRRALDNMGAASGVGFYLLPGNHDPLDPASIYRSPTFTSHRPDNVAVLDSSAPVQAAAGVELIAAPWPNKHPLTDLVDDACADLERGDTARGNTDIERGCTAHSGAAHSGTAVLGDAVRIVVGHGALDCLSPDPSNPALVSLARLEDRINEGSIHYAALGDRHSTTDVGASGRVWYSGAPEPTDYTESDPGNVLIVTLDDDGGCSVDKRRVGQWRFERNERAVAADADIDAVEEWLTGLPDKSRTIVKLALVGQVSVAQQARLESLLADHEDLLAALESWDRRSELAVIPDDADLEHFGLSGFAADAVSELGRTAESENEQDAVTARDALALLHRLAGATQ